MLADTARLAVQLDLKGNFASNLKSSQAALGKFDRQVSASGSRAYKAGQQIGTGIRNGAIIAAGGITFLASQVTLGLRSLATLEKAQAQTNAVLKSTKSVAGQTADSVRNLAEKYEALNATIDDKVIQSGENLLLTFTNIRKEAFEPALKTALDLNTRLGGGEGGLQNTIKLLGKALNDPLKGLGALSKAGITFSKQQTDQIKKLVKSNDLLGAQKLILTELGKRYGGAFAAEGKTAEGTLAGIGDAAEDLQKTLATGLFPVISKLLPKVRAALADPRVVAAVSKLGDSIAGLFSDANLAEGGKLIGSLFDTAKAAAPVLKDAAVATLGAVKAAVSLFTSLPKEVQQLAIGAFAVNKITGGLVTNIAGGLISSVLRQLVSGVVNVNGAVVNVVGGGGLPGTGVGVGGKGGGLAGAIKTGLKVAIPIAAAAAAFEATDQATGSSQLHAGAVAAAKAAGKDFVIVGRGGPQGFGQPSQPGPASPSFAAQQAAHFAQVNARPTGKDRDDVANLVQLQKGTSAFLRDQLRQMLQGLKSASGPSQIQAAIKSALGLLLNRHGGGIGGAKATLSELRIKLAETHDPKTARLLRAAIGKVEARLAGRQYVQKRIAQAEALLRSSKSSKDKIAELTRIQRIFTARGDTKAAALIGAKIETAKRAQVAAAKSAGQQAAFAIRDKELSVRNNITINTAVKVSARETIKTQTTYKKYFSTAS